MGHYLDGEDNKVFVKMYKGRAIGLSFPTDGNKHNDRWVRRFEGFGVEVDTYEDGELITVVINLPENVTELETWVG